MAITIDFANLIISVPVADLTLVSGNIYTCDTETQFRQIVNAIMDNEEGIVFDTPIDHNTTYTVAGITYARKIELINSYRVQFTPDAPASVLLEGSNNNLFDLLNGVLIQNQVQVIPTNSAGLIVIQSGSGLNATQDARLKAAYDILRGKNVINRSTGEIEVYDDAGALLYTAPIYEDAAGTVPVGANSVKIDRRDRLE